MIEEFTKIWFTHKDELENQFKLKHPEDYQSIVTSLISLLNRKSNNFIKPDPIKITVIDHDIDAGVLLFIIGDQNYQTDVFWYVFINYGSCSVTDTFKCIREINYDNPPTQDQVEKYMVLALHILQSIKPLKDN